MTTAIIQTAQPKTSGHVGKIGDRVRVEGVIRKMLGGKPIMHIIEDIDGNQFVVRRNSPLGRTSGVLVTIEADVLEHRVHAGVKQTALSAGHQEIVTEAHAFRRGEG